ncbi:MAG: PA0069 family radical SAM protein [Paracoccaceae bacterium]
MTRPNPSLAPWIAAPARAAVSNASGRFEAEQREAFDDGWDMAEDPVSLATEVRLENARSALVRNTSPDLGFDRSVNPYRGCEHGCIYCFARPTHAYLGLSPGLDFETRLIARPGIDAVLAREMSRKGYRVAPIAIGTNTDPYQPVEAKQKVMRALLGVLCEFRHPVTVTTKGTLVERDSDLLGEMAERGLACVGISLTTLDPGLSRAMEPRAPAPARRLRVIEHLARAGIPVRAMVAPVVPGLTDHEIEAILAAAASAGAQSASWITLRLPGEVAGLWSEWLGRHYPGRAAGIMARLGSLHGGKSYDAAFGTRMTGQGPWAELIARRFEIAAQRNGLLIGDAALDCTQFRVPARGGEQLSLF